MIRERREAAHKDMIEAKNLEEWTIAYKRFRANGGVL